MERGWKGKPASITPARTAAHRRHSKAEVSLWHSPPWVSRRARCFWEEGSAAFQTKTPRDDLWQPESPCLSKGAVRQCNWASSQRSQACPAPSSQSSLLPLRYFLDWVSNKSANWSCLLCKQMKGWADTKGRAEEAWSWKLMRKEEGAWLAPLGRSKPPVWLRPYHLTSRSIFHILLNILIYGFCLSRFHLQFQLLKLILQYLLQKTELF